MKAINLNVDRFPDKSFQIWKETNTDFEVPWHKHEELELMYIEKGTGVRYIGDSVAQYNTGDIYFLGANIPHYFSNSLDVETNTLKEVTFYCLTVKQTLFNSLIDLHEFSPIKNLFREAKYGLYYSSNASIIKSIEKTEQSTKALRFSALIELFDALANAKSGKIISLGYTNSFNKKADDRISKVYQYINRNLKNEIFLDAAADIAAMSNNAFSRFFKQQTNKTFSQFIIENRIGRACKLLIESSLNVSQIASEVGFSNQSNFNKQFKKIIHKSPLEYKREFVK